MNSIIFNRHRPGLRFIFLCIFLIALTGNRVQAQPTDTLTAKGLLEQFVNANAATLEDPEALLNLLKNPQEAVKLATDFVERPETLNEIFQKAVIPRVRFLKDLNVQFKTFTAADTITSLGFSYKYTKNSISKTFIDKDPTIGALFAQVKANGDVAFNPALNPKNFLQTNASGHALFSFGGTKVTEPADSITIARRRALLQIAAGAANPETNEAAKTLTAEQLGQLSTQVYFDFSFAGGYESNQDFSSRQLVFGLDLGTKITPFSNPNANFFDWPFAAVRWLAGADNWQPRAGSFPTVIVGLDRINPSNNTAREMAGDTDIFNRFRAEIAFRTPITAGAFFNANVRYYKQLDPSQVIIDANLNEQFYFTASLTAPNGLFVSYTTGRLPFDQTDDQIYELGFQYTF